MTRSSARTPRHALRRAARPLVARPLVARAVLACALAAATACGDSSTSPGARALRIGVLADTTGAGATLGARAVVAARAAADDYGAGAGSEERRVEVVVRDTRFEPARAADAVRSLAREGVRIVVGPQSSAEVAAAKAVADSAGVLLVSYGSTAGGLAIAGDNVFRLVPDDRREGAAHAALMWADGARVVVPLWRGDPGNDGLRSSVAESFTALGGAVTAGVRYDPATVDFAPALATVRAEAATAVAAHGAAAVVVYLAAFDEAAAVLARAAGDPVLAAVRWHGGDGANQSAAVLADPSAASFAAAVAFRTATYGLDDALVASRRSLIDRIAGPGAAPPPFALAAYDAVTLAARTLAAAGGADAAALGAEFARQAQAHTGATGPTALNAAGDRATGDYDFYQVCAAPAGHTWRRAATYRAGNAAAQIVRQGCGAP
jgi:branched-chain amino acid transport system substrate-binding protein